MHSYTGDNSDISEKSRCQSEENSISEKDLNETFKKLNDDRKESSKLENEFKTFLKENDQTPAFILNLRTPHKDKSLQDLLDLYFNMLGKINDEKSNKNYEKMIMYAQMSLGLIEPLIISEKEEYGAFNLSTIPALEFVLPHYAVKNLKGQIKNIEEIVNHFPELSPWRDDVEKAKEMTKIASTLYKHIKENPGTIQKNLKKEISYDNGKLIANTLYYMELNKKIQKEKYNNTYKLFVIESNS
ncbi:MAG: hypothetical protein L6420_00275 [Elusimicrobia bacterium]|nr:hypothetical protein [Elusimicrobiota bacterium]